MLEHTNNASLASSSQPIKGALSLLVEAYNDHLFVQVHSEET
jgi:hypothetical protein